MSNIKIDRVKDVISELEHCGSALQMNWANMLKEAIATEPEIPEGCPVIITYSDSSKQETFKTKSNSLQHLEIDYQRAGHVIPWNGGDLERLGINTSTDNLCVFTRNGNYGPLKKCVQSFNWMWEDRKQKGYDIIAYVIWPEWVK